MGVDRRGIDSILVYCVDVRHRRNLFHYEIYDVVGVERTEAHLSVLHVEEVGEKRAYAFHDFVG